MLVFDTSFLIDAMRGNREALAKLNELEKEDELLCTTSLNALELFRGAYLSSKTEEKIAKVRRILEQLLVLPITEETYDVYGAIFSALISQGQQIGDFDEIIAAIAISHNGAIVTRDRHFDRIPMLNVIHY
jgi:predicted nucleic acid-binding protein